MFHPCRHNKADVVYGVAFLILVTSWGRVVVLSQILNVNWSLTTPPSLRSQRGRAVPFRDLCQLRALAFLAQHPNTQRT